VSGYVSPPVRPRIENASSTHSISSSLATDGCGSSSVTLPARVLTFMAAITSVLIDAESA
jgi:hypothetical protein